MDTQHLCHDAADLCGGIELALAFTAFGGKVAHQILVGIAENIVALCPIPGKIKRGILEYGDKVGERIDLVFSATELGVVVEVRHVGELVGARQRAENALVDLVANVGFAFEGNMSLKLAPSGMGMGVYRMPAYLSLTYLTKSRTRT